MRIAWSHAHQPQIPQETCRTCEDDEHVGQPMLELPVSIKDNGDGTYLVTYTAPLPGKVSVKVMLDEQDGSSPKDIRGSPFTATFVEKPRPRANEFSGPSVTTFVSNTINLLEKFCLRTEAGLQVCRIQHDCKQSQYIFSVVKSLSG